MTGVSLDDVAAGVVDADALVGFLEAQGLLAAGEPLDVTLLSGGRSNLTFLVRAGPRALILRRRPLGPVARGANDMAREFRVQAALQGSRVPVATTHAFSDDEAIVGAPFYVMDRVAGVVWDGPDDVAGLAEADGAAASSAVIDALVELHTVDYEAVGLTEHGRPDGFLERRISRWLEQWRQGETRDLPLAEDVGERLLAALPPEAVPGLVHGDYRLGNVIVADDTSRRVNAVLDWEMSTIGDRLTDVAHLLVYWDTTRGRVTHPAQRLAGTHGFWSGERMAETYLTRRQAEVDDLDFYLAFEHWRAAVIKEGIHARSAAGNTRGEGFAGIGDQVPLHLEEADELLREHGR
jgi:aminoglycoside phosphotransferase (APT) family kinase protein